MIAILIFLVMFIGIFGLVLFILYRTSHISKRKIKKCTQETSGTIEKFRLLDDGMRITVSYTVNGIGYKISENVGQYRVDDETLPKGMRRYRQYINGKPGDKTPVMYDPDKPSRAYLKDNKGHTFYG